MVPTLLALALVTAVHGAPAQGARGSVAGRPLSWDQAESLARKLDAIEKRRQVPKPGKSETIVVTEGELNSYLNLGLGPKLPQGLTELDVQLQEDRIAAKALVDLEQVRGKMPATNAWNPVSYLTGRVPVELTGRYRSQEEGFGILEVENVRLSALPIPVSFLEQLVVSLTRSSANPQGFDIHAPFRLPYAVRRLRLQTGRALLEL